MKRTRLTLVPAFALAVVALIGVAATAGCNGNVSPEQHAQQLSTFRAVVEVLEAHDVAYSADVRIGGSPEFYEKASLGMDTDVEIIVHAQGNAGSAPVAALAPPPE